MKREVKNNHDAHRELERASERRELMKQDKVISENWYPIRGRVYA